MILLFFVIVFLSKFHAVVRAFVVLDSLAPLVLDVLSREECLLFSSSFSPDLLAASAHSALRSKVWLQHKGVIALISFDAGLEQLRIASDSFER